ncbi:hypothetical protein Tcan_09155, partial [Toxocara canis]
ITANGCVRSADVRLFYEKSHIIILVQKKGEAHVYYSIKKVEFDAFSSHWSSTLRSKEILTNKRRLEVGKRSSLNMCFVKGYMLRCFVKESKRRPQECAARMKSISRDWLTDQSEDSAEVSPEQMAGENLFFTNSCNVSTNHVYMKDGKDLIVQLSGKTGGQYFSNNQLLWNRGSPNELPCIKGEGGPAKELGSHLLMSWSGDDIVTRCVFNRFLFLWMKSRSRITLERKPIKSAVRTACFGCHWISTCSPLTLHSGTLKVENWNSELELQASEEL